LQWDENRAAPLPGRTLARHPTDFLVSLTTAGDRERTLFRAVIDQFPSAAAVLEGSEHLFVAASGAYIRIAGGRELLGRTFAEAFPELVEQGFLQLLDGVHATGRPAIGTDVRAEWDSDGDGEVEARFVDFTYQPLTGPDGRVWGIVVHVADVTARYEAAAALRSSEAHFRAVFENAAIGIALGGPDMVPVAINPALGRILRYTLEELRVTGFRGITHPDDRGADARLYEELLSGQRQSYRVEKRYIRRGGGTVWAEVTVSLVRGDDGEPLYTIGMVQDLTERKRVEALLQEQAIELEHQVEEAQALNEELESINEELRTANDEAIAGQTRLAFLSRASEMLGSSLDYEATLRSVATLAIEQLADWCVVEIAGPGGARQSRYVAHRDPDKVAWADEIGRRYPPDPGAPTGTPAVLRTGRSEFYEHVTDEMLQAVARDEDHLRILREVGFTGAIIVPITVRGRALGTLSLISSHGGRRYTREDLALAEDLGRRAGTAVENAQLFRETERAADRSRRLQAFAAALNEAASVADVAEVCVVHGMEALGAGAGSLGLLVEGGTVFEIAHSRGYPPEATERWKRFPLHRGRPLSDAVLDGKPRILGTFAEIAAAYPEMQGEFAGTGAFVAIPVAAGGSVLGGLSFTFAGPQEFDSVARTFVLTLGEQAAQALERARLLEAEQRLRARTEILAEAGGVLAESLDIESTLGALARLVVPRVADWCFVELQAPDGRIEHAAIHHGDPARVAWAKDLLARYPIDLEAPYGTPQVLRTGKPELVPEFPEEAFEMVARDEEHLRALRASGFRSHLSLPLQVRGRTMGVLSLVSAESGRRFGPDDLAFGLDLAHRAALAIDNARLYEAERQARELAEVANRSKSEFLSVMSHELRTPLNAIAGYTELIEMGVHGPVTPEQREALLRIQRSQKHLLGLIDDVLNYARLESGTMRYALQDVTVDQVVQSAEALVAPQLQAKGLAYEASCGALAVRADPEKLRQILLNLLGNAIKFTERGGRITVECAAAGEHVTISVTDTGIGISPERLESIFEPFVQVDARLTRTEEGVGLGLAISRDLARGMGPGSDLTVRSTPGAGSTFILTLPLASHRDTEAQR
jgi:PAS domain S-box-containing protein